MLRKIIFIVSLCAIFPSISQAQSVINDYARERKPEQRLTGFGSLGMAALPEYDGSKDYQTIPIISGQINKGNYYAATRGLGAFANVIDSNSFNAGPIINFRFGRNDDVENQTIAKLRNIDNAFELGGFVSYVFRSTLKAGDNLEISANLTKDIAGGHNGIIGEIGASYFVPVRRDLRLGVNFGIDYQSKDYMRQYFSIDADNSARSGLAQYNASGGFNSFGLGTIGLYSINSRWGLVGVLQYTRWISDAAKSPIITQEGTKNQVFGAVGITYRF